MGQIPNIAVVRGQVPNLASVRREMLPTGLGISGIDRQVFPRAGGKPRWSAHLQNLGPQRPKKGRQSLELKTEV